MTDLPARRRRPYGQAGNWPAALTGIPEPGWQGAALAAYQSGPAAG
jgi:hypothetical protein